MALEAPPPVQVRKLTFHDVLAMVDAEIIKDTERVELVDGVLVSMSPEGWDHADVVTWMTRVLTDTYDFPLQVRVNSTFPLSEHDYRLPDVYVTRPLATRHWAERDEVILAVEVAQASIRTDLGPKARQLAEWGVPVYWVLDLAEQAVVIHADPAEGGYRSVTRRAGREAVGFPASDRVMAVEDLLTVPSA